MPAILAGPATDRQLYRYFTNESFVPGLGGRLLGELRDQTVDQANDSRQNDPNPVIASFHCPYRHRPAGGLSSQVVGHRLSGAGDRKLNHAL